MLHSVILREHGAAVRAEGSLEIKPSSILHSTFERDPFDCAAHMQFAAPLRVTGEKAWRAGSLLVILSKHGQSPCESKDLWK